MLQPFLLGWTPVKKAEVDLGESGPGVNALVYKFHSSELIKLSKEFFLRLLLKFPSLFGRTESKK